MAKFIGETGLVYLWAKIKAWVGNYAKITETSGNKSLTVGNTTATLPTKTSQLTNDSDFVTSADIPEGAAASTTTPKMDGTAAVGTETRFARGDHRHPSDTSKQDVISDLATIRSNASAGAAKVSNVQADWNASTGLAVILNKPTIPAEVTESTVAGWGFTKNTGTYSKPSTGIPKTDLANAVQTSLGLADTALQSFTESDPVFIASAAHGISSTDISNWNAKGTYSKPSGGIPKTDLASAVQTSLGKADTALQSYTETDPVFVASAAHGITSSDITNWNSKTSNIGTITGIKMNGFSKGTSGVVDLGTVITAHQDISGKADKATTLAGYGIINAYTKTESDGKYYALYGGTNLNPSSTNAVDLDSLTTPGSYYCASDAASEYVSNKPSSVNGAFRVWVSCPNGADTYLRQRCQGYSSYNVYERFYNKTSWSGWNLVQAWLGSYLPLAGGDVTGELSVAGNINAGSHINLNNANWIQMKDTGGTLRACIAMTASNNLSIGYGLPGVGDINIYATNFRIRVNGTAASNQALLINSDQTAEFSSSVTAASFIGDVTGNASTATTLETSRRIWGQTFNGSAAVKGTLYMQTDESGATVNSDSAKLKFSPATLDGTNIYRSPYIQAVGGTTYGRHRLSIFQSNATNYTDGFNEVFTIMPTGRVGIGTVAPGQLLEVAGIVKCTSVDTSSDETLKKRVGDININVEDIAAAPNITFTWKKGEDTENIHGGTYAQYWEKVTPYYVHGKEGDKSLDYASLAVSCSIELAKEVVALKEENAQLKKELIEIKEMISKLNK